MRFFLPIELRMAVAVILTTTLIGCEGKPDRKKLPDFTDIYGWEEMPLTKNQQQPAFVTADTMVIEAGKRVNYLSVSMPDPDYDSLAIAMVTDYEPLAGSFMENWARQHKKGILIDLRNKERITDAISADYLVSKKKPDGTEFRLPIFFVWDRGSAYRANYLMDALRSMPGINCELNGYNAASSNGRQDCFRENPPDFDH